MAEDVVDVISAAYALDLDEGAWLERVTRAVHAELDRGLGVISFAYHLSSEGKLELERAMAVDVPPDYAALLPAVTASFPPEFVRQTFAQVPCNTASRTGNADARSRSRQGIRQVYGALGWRDLFVVNGLDPTGHGVYLAAARARLQQATPQQRRRWTRVAVHLAAAWRLHRRVHARPTETPEAVLTPAGRLDHAEGEASTRQARQSLADAARTLERARSRRRRDPDRVVAEWTGLIAARWSLVDHFESDGRRYLVARRNDLVDVGEAALSPRELQAVAFAALGHSNKLIGYEMGVSPLTVGALLHRAARKLGARSRAQLIQLAKLRFTPAV